MSRKQFLTCFFVTVMTATAAHGQSSLSIKQYSAAEIASKLVVSITTDTPATSYTVTVQDHNSGAVLSTQTSTTSQVTTAPVPPNTIVDVVATAHNSTSISAPAKVSLTTAPAPPTGIGGSGGPSKVTVYWQAAPGAASYRLTLSNGMSFVTASTSYTVTGLQNATSYNVIVASINSAGLAGAFSAPVAVRTANIALQ